MMSRPTSRIVWMAVGLIAALFLTFLLLADISAAFWHNPALNTGILLVLLVGILFVFWQVLTLNAEIDWIESFQRGQHGAAGAPTPRLLVPLAAMIKDKVGSRFSVSATSLRSVLDGLQARLDEGHEISRYLITLLILLGLLGTFWGLLGTINAVAEAIRSLDMSGTDPATMFDQLKSSLQAPLKGMGTAFSASLFGLAGSLLLGYLDLQAGQARNRFFAEVEDWLSGQARLTGGGPIAEGEQSVPVYIQALLEQTAESLENLQRSIARTESDRAQSNANFKALADHLVTLSDQMRQESQVMGRVAETQSDMRQVIQRLTDLAQQGGFGIDPTSRNHLRNIDVQLARLGDELNAGRNALLQELRSEIKLLARTIAVAAGLER